MASEKRPSIYKDRCSVGSSSELDEYGVWIKSGPEDLSPGGGDINIKVPASLLNPDIPDVFDVGAEPESDDFSLGDTVGADLEVPFDESLNLNNLDDLKADFPVSDDQFDLSVEEPQASGGDGDYNEISPDDSSGNFGEPVNPPDAEGSLPEESSGLESFNMDLSLPDSFEADTFEPEASSSETPAPEKTGSPEISTQVLKQIAGELASIRSELSLLKEEFSQARSGANPEPVKDNAHGFFDGEDDEKIALTGNELDNIINTAEFIEETGEGVANSEEIEALLNVEVKPVIPAPEDTAYLDESPLADGGILPDEKAENPSLSTEELDTSDPGLSSFDLDEQNISLDLSEESSADTVEEAASDTAETTGDEPAAETPDDLTSNISLDNIPPSDDFAEEITVDEPPAGEISPDDIRADDLDIGDVGNIGIDDTNVDETTVDDASFEGENTPDLPAIDLDLEEADESLPDDTTDEETIEEDELEIPLSDFAEGSAVEGVEVGEDLIPEGFTGEPAEALEEPAVDDEKAPVQETAPEPPPAPEGTDLANLPPAFGDELRTVLSYMDQLLESLPEDKIEEFAQSEYFDTYKKLFKELGLN